MLLRTSVTAFAAAISLGLWSEVSNSALAHDIYSTLRDRDGHLCCGGQTGLSASRGYSAAG